MRRIPRRAFLKTTGAAALGAAALGAAPDGTGQATAAPPSGASGAPPAQQGPAVDRTVLPLPDPTYTGTINQTLEGSTTDWGLAAPPQAPAGAPNVVVVLIDDAGFGNPSTFGGPISTPNFTRLGQEGLLYNHFHVVALCSPTRAALLTGRNHHFVGFGSIAEASGPFPGYSTNRPQSCAPFPRVLQLNGYATGMFGKGHITTDDVQGAAGPFNHWPNGWGFDYYYGFLGGDSGQFDPLPAENDHVVGVQGGKDYFFTDDITDRAISWIRNVRAQDADKPYFVYFATGATHAPHQVPPEWSDKYRGKFDQGWDRLREEVFPRQKQLGVIPANAQLTPRNEVFPAWDSLPADEKQLYSRQMEVFAGYGENADWNVGRLLDAIEGMGELDNTLFIWIWGDNGCSMEGTLTGTFNEPVALQGIPVTAEEQLELVQRYGGLPAWGTNRMYPHFSAAWAWAGNCPFQWGKMIASHLGGTRDGMAIRWPARIKDRGTLRTQFSHVIDVGPTILEVAGLPQPTMVDGVRQDPMQGTSFAYTFDNANAPERHTQQYFEIYGNRAMYKDGWWLSMRLPKVPWEFTPQAMAPFAPGRWNPDADPVELYYLPDDYSQANDLAAQRPDKVAELRQLWWEEAEKYHVKPVLAGYSTFFRILPPLPPSKTYTYYGSDVQNLLPGIVPPVFGHSYTISADLEVPPSGAEGVILAEADYLGGYALFVQDGKLKHTYSFEGIQLYRQEATEPLPTGNVNVRMEFAIDRPEPAAGGTVTLYVNGRAVGGGRIEHTVPVLFTIYAGLDVGRDSGLPVDPSYADKLPFAFTGTVKKVTVDVITSPSAADEQRLQEFAAQQRVVQGIRG